MSYARVDRAVARLFADSFAEEGFSVWWDASLHSGETFDEVIEQNLRDAKAVVVLWSPRSVASRWVRAEANLADRRNKLAPAIIEPCDRPIIFELTHAAELSHWTGDRSDGHWRTFINDLRRLVTRNGSKPAEKPADPRAVTAKSAPPPAPPKGTSSPAPIRSKAVPTDDTADAHYLELDNDLLGGENFLVNSAGAKIGRSAPAQIVLPDKSVSREHCIVGIANDELFVTDLNSTNGTFIDGQRITRATMLPAGSELRVGQISLRHAVRPRGGSERNGDAARASADH
nr:TIR domain-containing protein [uncultured Sphingomonas sp.]